MASGSEHVLEGENDVPGFRIYNNPTWRMELLKPIHTKYCRGILFSKFPADYQEYDTSKLTFLHFALASLDLLQSIDSLTQEEKEMLIESLYFLQNLEPTEASGFLGSKTLMFGDHINKRSLPLQLHASHITITFAALVSLLTLGDNLDRLDVRRILLGVAALQNKDGSFRAGPSCCESDMRFVYSAVAVCYILDDFSLVNETSLVSYIKRSFTYEGSFGSGSCGTEGHAAYTFCAVASLVLLGKLKETFTDEEMDQIRLWCSHRQLRGFTGRPNKEEDTCYSFWVGATLAMLESTDLSDCEENINYILHNQNPIIGGIGKQDNEFPDPLHTFMGIAGLSLAHYENLNPVNAALTMSQNAFEHMKSIQPKFQQR